MKERTTQYLLAAIALLLFAHLVRAARPVFSSPAQEKGQTPGVLRAQAIELVDKQGQVRAQLHLGEDGGGNLRLRDATGTVRVKLGATAQGAGLILMDQDVEPAIWMAVKSAETTLTLKEKGKQAKVLRP